ncbi:MAG: hypothetical protein E1N59_637 [Puniceicoccaceae bacterium 5H]|nr:MAG: hypothetical protein E1N59_637 [Puniceicoccaceae bacterium 5H]
MLLLAHGLMAQNGPRFPRQASEEDLQVEVNTHRELSSYLPAVLRFNAPIIGGSKEYLRVVKPVNVRYEHYQEPADRTQLLAAPEVIDFEARALKAHQEREAAKADALAAMTPDEPAADTPEPEANEDAAAEEAKTTADTPLGSPALPAEGKVITAVGKGSTANPEPSTEATLVEAEADAPEDVISEDTSREYLILFEKQLRQGEAKVPFRLPSDTSAAPGTTQLEPPGGVTNGARYRVVP